MVFELHNCVYLLQYFEYFLIIKRKVDDNLTLNR
jgi:hypothetical protein